MKRIIAFICVWVCLLSFVGCVPQKYDVALSCDGVSIGGSVADADVSLQINGKDTAVSKVYWSVMGEDSMIPISEEDTFEAGKYYQMYVYYPAEKGMTRDNAVVVFSGENGEHIYVEEEGGGLMSLVGFDFTDVPVLEISCDYATVGNTPGDVTTTLSFNGSSVTPTMINWSVMGEDSMIPISENDTFLAGEYYQMYLYYPAEEGMDRDSMAVVFNGENGEHMYVEKEGDELMSLIAFDFTNIPVLEITCEYASVGKTPGDVTTTLSFNGSSVTPTMINWSVMGEDSMIPISENDTFLAGEYYQMYLYYPAEEGMDRDSMAVVFNGENGEHLYVEVEGDDMMSLIAFDFTALEDTHTHKWTQDYSKKSIDAECLKDGIKYLVCTICGEKDSKKLSATGHDYQIDHLMDGSCTDGLLYLYICENCHDSKRGTVGPKEHSWGKASPITNFFHSYTCTVCNETKREDHSLDGTGYCIACDYFVVN